MEDRVFTELRVICAMSWELEKSTLQARGLTLSCLRQLRSLEISVLQLVIMEVQLPNIEFIIIIIIIIIHTGNSDPKAVRRLAQRHILPNSEEWHSHGRLQCRTPPVPRLQTSTKLIVM